MNTLSALTAPGLNPQQIQEARLWAARQPLPWMVEEFGTDEGRAWLCVTLLEGDPEADPASFFLERTARGVVAVGHAGEELAAPRRVDLVLNLAAGVVAASASGRVANDA